MGEEKQLADGWVVSADGRYACGWTASADGLGRRADTPKDRTFAEAGVLDDGSLFANNDLDRVRTRIPADVVDALFLARHRADLPAATGWEFDDCVMDTSAEIFDEGDGLVLSVKEDLERARVPLAAVQQLLEQRGLTIAKLSGRKDGEK